MPADQLHSFVTRLLSRSTPLSLRQRKPGRLPARASLAA
jgi:hypothetical protein